MAQAMNTGSPVMLEDELQAGFLLIQTELGGVAKELAAFEVFADTRTATYSRPCRRGRKRNSKSFSTGNKSSRVYGLQFPGWWTKLTFLLLDKVRVIA